MIDKTEAQAILLAIKTDDLVGFDKLTENGAKNLRFGRFPVLSLCYLYNSRRIVNAHEKQLLNQKDYEQTFEDRESYLRFKKAAGKSLRLFTGEGGEVSPIEMLAVLNRPYQLERCYPKLQKSQTQKARLEKIYYVSRSQKINASGNEITLPRAPMKKSAKLFLIAAYALIVIIVAFSFGLVDIAAGYADGSAERPQEAFTAELLASSVKSNSNFKLTQDISVTDSFTSFSGVLDGDGHTLIFQRSKAEPLFKTLTGTIKNVNISYVGGEQSISAGTSLLAGTNKGTIENVGLDTSMTLTVTGNDAATADSSLYIVGLVMENVATIRDCTVKLTATVNGTQGVNAYLSSVAGKNSGTVENCTVAEGSVINTVCCDVGGLVTLNEEKGNITGCTNNAAISQYSASESWSPNVAGIAMTNKGKIDNCVNYGALSAESATVEKLCEILVGGIACINYNTVDKCKNLGAVQAISDISYAYAGAIAAYNYDTNAGLSNCHGGGTVKATARGTAIVFSGGVIGCNNGYVQACVSSATVTKAGDNSFAGGIMGLMGSQVFYLLYVYSVSYSYNNFYLKGGDVTFGIATYLDGSSVKTATDLQTTPCDTLEILKAQEVYWE